MALLLSQLGGGGGTTTTLTADAGAFVLAGQAATFRTIVPAGAGAFTLSGQAAVLTLDVLGLVGTFNLGGQAAVFTTVMPGTFLWQRNTSDEYPLLFEQNEGFVIRATVPATGTWQFSINVEWAEVDPTAVTGW